MKRLFLLCCALSSILPWARADSFESGIAAYEQGNYTQAIEAFNSCLSAGETPAIRHNLSLAYFQNGELAEAVWQLERALRLYPFQATYLVKLAALRQQLGLPIVEPGILPRLAQALPPSLAWIAASLAFWGLLATLILPRCFGKPAGWVGKVTRLACALTLVLAGISLFLNRNLADSGICLVSTPAELRAAPAAAAPTTGLARPGERAHRMEQYRAYAKVRTESGAEGWLPEAQFRLLKD